MLSRLLGSSYNIVLTFVLVEFDLRYEKLKSNTKIALLESVVEELRLSIGLLLNASLFFTRLLVVRSDPLQVVVYRI